MTRALALALFTAAAPNTVSLDMKGTLGESLKAIAAAGHVNLVVTGDFDQPAEVHLKEVAAEDALRLVAQAHHAAITEGAVWTIVAPPRRGAGSPTEADDDEGAGGTLRLGPNDERDVVGTGPLRVEPNETVHNLVAYGGGAVVGEGATVTGDAVAFGGDVTLGEGATVRGDAVSIGGHVVKGRGAVVQGQEVGLGKGGLGVPFWNPSGQGVQRSWEFHPFSKGEDALRDNAMPLVPRVLVRFAVFFIIGLFAFLLAPNRFTSVERELRSSFAACGGVGLLAAIATIPLTLILFVTLIGIPLALALWFFLSLLVVVGIAAAAHGLGASLPVGALKRTHALALAVGTLAIALLGEVPVLGALTLATLSLAAIGAFIRTRLGRKTSGMPYPDDAAVPA